jgi:hypothetical protein
LSSLDCSPVIGSICCSQTPHREFDLSVWQLSPLLNHCHVAALRKLIENLASLEASRYDRQSESLSRRVSISLTPVGYALGKIAGSLGHVATPMMPPTQYSGRSIDFFGNGGGFPAIHR